MLIVRLSNILAILKGYKGASLTTDRLNEGTMPVGNSR
jgi:hypothetical protein